MVRRYAKSEDRMVLGNSLVLISQISSSLYFAGKARGWEEGTKAIQS